MLSNSNFNENSATLGGAIYNEGCINATDTSFTNNSALEKGGAIYSNYDITINAENKNVTFSGNSATDGGDIYMATDNSNLTLNTGANAKTITMNGGISGSSNGFNTTINGNGVFDLQSYIKNSKIQIYLLMTVLH